MERFHDTAVAPAHVDAPYASTPLNLRERDSRQQIQEALEAKEVNYGITLNSLEKYRTVNMLL